MTLTNQQRETINQPVRQRTRVGRIAIGGYLVCTERWPIKSITIYISGSNKCVPGKDSRAEECSGGSGSEGLEAAAVAILVILAVSHL